MSKPLGIFECVVVAVLFLSPLILCETKLSTVVDERPAFIPHHACIALGVGTADCQLAFEEADHMELCKKKGYKTECEHAGAGFQWHKGRKMPQALPGEATTLLQTSEGNDATSEGFLNKGNLKCEWSPSLSHQVHSTGNLNTCKQKCTGNCNAIALNPSTQKCNTYVNCKMSTDRQTWGYTYYLKKRTCTLACVSGTTTAGSSLTNKDCWKCRMDTDSSACKTHSKIVQPHGVWPYFMQKHADGSGDCGTSAAAFDEVNWHDRGELATKFSSVPSSSSAYEDPSQAKVGTYCAATSDADAAKKVIVDGAGYQPRLFYKHCSQRKLVQDPRDTSKWFFVHCRLFKANTCRKASGELEECFPFKSVECFRKCPAIADSSVSKINLLPDNRGSYSSRYNRMTALLASGAWRHDGVLGAYTGTMEKMTWQSSSCTDCAANDVDYLCKDLAIQQ